MLTTTMLLETTTEKPQDSETTTIISLQTERNEKEKVRTSPPPPQTTMAAIRPTAQFERSNTIESHEWFPSGPFYKVEKEERNSKSFALRQPREKMSDEFFERGENSFLSLRKDNTSLLFRNFARTSNIEGYNFSKIRERGN